MSYFASFDWLVVAWIGGFFVATFGSLLLVGWISDRLGWD